MENVELLSTTELRERRRLCKTRAYNWLYDGQGTRPHEVDILLAIDSEIKRRMRKDLETMDLGSLSHVYLEKTYGLPVRKIRELAYREDEYLALSKMV